MKMINTLFLFLFLSNYCLAQNKKFFLSSNDEITDSISASSYIITYEKLPGDTIFRMEQFSMDNQLMTSGSFKDLELSIPHGDFRYYKDLSDNESEKYLESTGKYLLGKRNAEWKIYFPNGEIKMLETYKDDVLNGRTEIYNKEKVLVERGDFINGLREGKWLIAKGLSEDTFKQGMLIKSVINKEIKAEMDKIAKEDNLKLKEEHKYDRSSKQPAGFGNELSKFMSLANSNGISLETAIVTFELDEKSQISKISVSGITDFSLAAKIKEFFLKSDNWKPATIGIEKKPIRSWVRYRLYYN